MPKKLRDMDLFTLICKVLLDPPSGCGPLKESAISDLVEHSRADVQLTLVRLSISGICRMIDNNKDDPLWSLTLAGKRGQEAPRLNMKPEPASPEIVELENQKTVALQMKSVPDSKTMMQHAAFLAQMAIAKTTFSEKLNTRRAAVEEVKKPPAGRRKSSRSEGPYQAKNDPSNNKKKM